MLRTNQLILRAIEPSDLELLYAWENDSKNWDVSNTLSPFSKATLARFINDSQDIYASKQQRLMIDLVAGNKTIGCIDFFDFDPKHKRAGVGILIAIEQERGKGYAKVALNELVDYSREVLDLNQLYCNISEENDASIKLFSNQGFKKIGLKKDWNFVNGSYKNEYLFQLINN